MTAIILRLQLGLVALALVALPGCSMFKSAPPVESVVVPQPIAKPELVKYDVETRGQCVRLTDSGSTLGYRTTWFSFVNGCAVPVFVYWCDKSRSTNACRANSFGHMIDLMANETEWSWYDTSRFNGVVMAACPQKTSTGEDVFVEIVSQTPLDAQSPYRCFYYRKSS